LAREEKLEVAVPERPPGVRKTAARPEFNAGSVCRSDLLTLTFFQFVTGWEFSPTTIPLLLDDGKCGRASAKSF
jgi:hypothetical protein